MFRRQVGSSLVQLPVGEERRLIELSEYEAPGNDKHRPVRALAMGLREVEDDLAAAIVFSSVATGDIVEHWSDLDVMVVLKDEVIVDSDRFLLLREKLIGLEQYLYEFDPWQHHGIQFVTEADIRFYPESFLPLAVFERGKSLLGPTQLTFQLRDSRAEQEAYFKGVAKLMKESADNGEMKHHCKDGVCLQEDYRNASDNFYQLKYFVSVVLMMPSLYVGLVDEPIYKRESFEKIREYFSEEELELVRACEQVRLLFASIKSQANEIPKEVKDVLGNKYLARAAKLMETMVEKYEKSGLVR